jgi:hypothetical protein
VLLGRLEIRSGVSVEMAAGSLKGARVLEVDELLRKLNLSEAEREGVVLRKADQGNLPEVKWMSVAKLLTIKGFSEVSLEKTMRAAWNIAREVTFRPIGKNLFVIQAFCLGDWNRIMDEGPWLFRDCALMLEKYDGRTAAPSVVPSRVVAWIQIHRVPHLYRIEEILKQLAAKVGEVEKVEARVASFGNGEFQRARVKLFADKPLPRVVTFSPEGCENMLLLVMYEKMPKFCAFCGMMGHEHLECGTGEYAANELQFGKWMLAAEESWHPSTPRVRKGYGAAWNGDRGGRSFTADHGGRTAGRGGGRARRGGGRAGGREAVWREKEGQNANNGPRKRSSGEAGLGHDGDGLEDTASSPLKTAMEGTGICVENPAAKKQLDMGEAAGAMAERVPPPPAPNVKDKKKQKKTGSGNGKNKSEASMDDTTPREIVTAEDHVLAASLSEDRRGK